MSLFLPSLQWGQGVTSAARLRLRQRAPVGRLPWAPGSSSGGGGASTGMRVPLRHFSMAVTLSPQTRRVLKAGCSTVNSPPSVIHQVTPLLTLLHCKLRF